MGLAKAMLQLPPSFFTSRCVHVKGPIAAILPHSLASLLVYGTLFHTTSDCCCVEVNTGRCLSIKLSCMLLKPVCSRTAVSHVIACIRAWSCRQVARARTPCLTCIQSSIVCVQVQMEDLIHMLKEIASVQIKAPALRECGGNRQHLHPGDDVSLFCHWGTLCDLWIPFCSSEFLLLTFQGTSK